MVVIKARISIQMFSFSLNTATNKISKLANNWKTVGTTVWFKKSIDIDNNMRYKCTEQLITLYNIKMKE